MATEGRYPARMNIRLSQETYDAFEEVSELLETDVTSLARLFLDGAQPSLDAMATAARSARTGQVVQAVEVLERLAASLVAESQLHQSKTEVLRGELEAKVKSA